MSNTTIKVISKGTGASTEILTPKGEHLFGVEKVEITILPDGPVRATLTFTHVELQIEGITKLGLVTPQETDSTLVCDLCGKVIVDFDNDLFHHTGILKGRLNKHIHLCSQCHNPALMEIYFDLKL